MGLTSMDNNRRRFERLAITEHAVAVDENGRQLGPVKQASGAGMLIIAESDDIVRDLPVGKCMRVTIIEPQSGTATAMDVEVKSVIGKGVGMEFVNFGAGVP